MDRGECCVAGVAAPGGLDGGPEVILVLGVARSKHHELHKMRACFTDIEKHIEQLKHTKDAEDDPYTLEVFRGEIIGIEKALTEINKEDADCDLIQEIEDDLKRIKEKLAGVFGK